jgi:hypothetical protein
MPRLPFRRRKTKLDTVKDLAQIYTTLKLSQAGGKAAKKAAKGYAGVKAAKGGGKVLRPALAALGIGALVAFLKKRNRQPTGYEPPVGSSPGSTPSAYPSGAGPGSSPTAPAPTDAAPPTSPQPSGGGVGDEPETTDLEAGSVPGRESFPLGSSVSTEEETPAGSPGAPKSASTESGSDGEKP